MSMNKSNSEYYKRHTEYNQVPSPARYARLLPARFACGVIEGKVMQTP